MKVEVIKNEEQEITYPCLMAAINNNFIVYFTEPKVGVVVSSPDDSEHGRFSADWSMQKFKPFTGKLVLSNE